MRGSGTFVKEWGGCHSLDRLAWLKYPGGNASQSGEQVNCTYSPNEALASVVGQST